MSRAIGAHIPRGHRQQETVSHLPPAVVTLTADARAFKAFARFAGVTVAPYEYRQPVHHDPHQCPDCRMCLCACEDCHTRLAQHCICADCPCGLGDTGSAAEVAAFEATHWKHAEETT